MKSQPDPASGKAKSVPIGSINRATLVMSQKLRANCSAEDLKEIQGWVRRHKSVHELKRRHAALTLPEQMAAAAEWFATASPDEAREAAEDVMANIGALRRTLSKRGLL